MLCRFKLIHYVLLERHCFHGDDVRAYSYQPLYHLGLWCFSSPTGRTRTAPLLPLTVHLNLSNRITCSRRQHTRYFALSVAGAEGHGEYLTVHLRRFQWACASGFCHERSIRYSYMGTNEAKLERTVPSRFCCCLCSRHLSPVQAPRYAFWKIFIIYSNETGRHYGKS